MSAKEKWLWTYRVVRSVLFTAIIFVTVLYVGMYVTLSIPSVQRHIRDVAQRELSKLVGSHVAIGDVAISPFSEIVVSDIDLYEPDCDSPRCLHVDKLGAGISLWSLISDQKIIITYAELIGMQADVRQRYKDGPLNIQFLIDAFAPKDKNKPPARFDLQIRNIVIRKSSASFHRLWIPRSGSKGIDINHLDVTGLNADVALPRLSNDLISIDLRRLALTLGNQLEITRISLLATIDHGDLSVEGLKINFPNSRISVSDLNLPLSRYGGNFGRMMDETELYVKIDVDHLVPAEFSAFWPSLSAMQTPYSLTAELSGNISHIGINQLRLENPYSEFLLEISDASIRKGEKGLSDFDIPTLRLEAGHAFMRGDAKALLNGKGGKLADILDRARYVDLYLKGHGSVEQLVAEAELTLSSGFGDLDIQLAAARAGSDMRVSADMESDGISVDGILGGGNIGNTALSLDADLLIDPTAIRAGNYRTAGNETGLGSIDLVNGYIPEGRVDLTIPSIEINGYTVNDININIEKTPQTTSLLANCTDDNLQIAIDSQLQPAGKSSLFALDADVSRFCPLILFPGSRLPDASVSAQVEIDVEGNNADNLIGSLSLNNFDLQPLGEGRSLRLGHLLIHSLCESDDSEDEMRRYSIDSDWLQGNIYGHFTPSHLPSLVKRITSGIMPNSIMPAGDQAIPAGNEYLEYDFRIFRGGTWAEFLNLPVRLLYEADISGDLNEAEKTLTLNMSAPYIQQGRDKLIQKTRLSANVHGGKGNLSFFSSIPTKKGVLDLNTDVAASAGLFDVTLGFNRESKGGFYGELSLDADITRALNADGRLITAHIHPSMLYLNKAGWSVGESTIVYADNQIDVSGFSIAHDDQFVTIGGTASADPEKEILVRLRDIDLDYIFDTLNINYVSFGGHATGEAVGRGLLSHHPEAFTRWLDVKDLSYNHAVLGDGKLRGDFDAASKRVGIYADISEEGRRVAEIDGGIWIGRDSLAFALDADKVRIGFLQPFMSAFSSKVEGRASGKAELYGTFSDIDMKGRLFADTIRMKVDYTNVTYCGSDSVIIDPGHIDIPSFRLYDDSGHSALLTGTLNHRYFHDPDFRFTISNARNLLVYDTDATMNPVWYGRIIGSGGGQIIGRPGYVGILADMTTDRGSNFSFVLTDSEEALDYKFLTFTDKRKESKIQEKKVALDEPDEIVAAFNKKVAQDVAGESVFDMDIRATITPAASLTLVMDPVAGDRIRARGEGAMNMTYSSESNDIKMYGKYTLSEGTYNFSLQDLILKDFIIKPGSSISFNGDPLNGMLDIRAAYRVNTNLADLDKSFSTDHDLNRTNVPVDAMLLVNGEMTQPEISFDIELPTLNDEVAQKVRSIISSEDMMNRQIIYLLALNRFYTPEYMGGTTSGGEWASVASSTLSSQLSNMLGQLTDKVNIAPSLRSDKGDFSDLEVDLALSSRLFNNRLLINGNFGYRDKTSSSTTFIGDFDIEYLLNRSGNLRLKAYNHFNDQNYYLKSALTTQGLGVIWRRDFDRIFNKRKKKPAEKSEKPEKNDKTEKPE